MPTDYGVKKFITENSDTSPTTGFVGGSPSYTSLVDQIQQNNAWSAEQADKQMAFQENLFNRANAFNKEEAQVNRDFQQESADRAMAFSSAEAEKNRAWETMMSNTAHQREMADLKASGLNPILAANNGASIGSGATASSAQAAGYGASSTGSPSGAKGDTDESGTMAIANLLGRMLDNQTEIQKMMVSAETAKETAGMYTGASRYAAELASLASDIASRRSSEASRYGSELSYKASKESAEKYTDASRYAAELQALASDIASQRSSEASRYASELNSEASRYAAEIHSEASRYSSDLIYQASMNNPYNIIGDQINSILDELGNKGVTSASTVDLLFGKDNVLQSTHDTLMDLAKRAIEKVMKPVYKDSHYSGKF